MRLYHNVTSSTRMAHKLLCVLYCQYDHFDPCYVDDIFPTEYNTTSMREGVQHQTARLEQNLIGASDNTTDNEEPVNDTISAEAPAIVAEVSVSFTNTSKRIKTIIQDSTSLLDDLSSPSEALSFLKSLMQPPSAPGTPQSYGKLLCPKMWRFLPMADASVDEFLVRDLDSSVLDREVAAVTQWLNESTAILHVMRDHPSHNGVILAGEWHHTGG